VLEGRGCLGFVNEPFFSFGIACEFGRKELQGDWAVEPEVLGLIENTHAAATKVLEDPVMRKRLTDQGGHDNASSGGRMKKASDPLHRRISDALSKS